MSTMDFSQFIWFDPLGDNREPVQKLLALAIPIQDHLVATLEPIYMMNVVDDSSSYRSLIWAHTGNVFATTRSIAWVSETIFERMGFRYETWNSFWQEVGDNSHQMFPYVNGRSVFLKIAKGNKQTDWLNLTACVSMDFYTTLSHGSLSEPMWQFYFRLQATPSVGLGIRLPQKAAALNRQLPLAIQLREAWQCYYMRLVNQNLSKGYVESHDEWQERFAFVASCAKSRLTIDPMSLETFQLYQTICSYIERGHNELQQEVSQLLKKKSLDHSTLHFLWNQYRRRSDKDDNIL